MIELQLTDRAEKLRIEIARFLASHPPPIIPPRAGLTAFVDISREWQRRLAAERFVGVHFPHEFGGRGYSILEEAVIQEELARQRSPQLVGLFGLTMVGPVLLKHGSDEQKRAYLSRILSAEDLWCQGFSEPEAGSDLASLRTTAELQHGKWSVSGQKVWTSFAQYARYCFMLVRTDPQAARHRGLTYLLVDMSTPGITIRPLKQITGEEEFNELFLDSVSVPEEQVVGKPGDGWEIAISTLMFERVVLTFARHLQSEQALSEIADLLRERSAGEKEQEIFGRLIARSMAVRALALSHLVNYSEKHPGPEGSLDKLSWSETFQEICQFALQLLGPRAGILSGSSAHLGGEFAHRYLYSRGRTIAAGTSEIQRSIIAERILGLPRK